MRVVERSLLEPYFASSCVYNGGWTREKRTGFVVCKLSIRWSNAAQQA